MRDGLYAEEFTASKDILIENSFSSWGVIKNSQWNWEYVKYLAKVRF